MSRPPLRFETIGDPAALTERTLAGRIVELNDRPCQARKRDGEVCGKPSRQWTDGIGTRCWRHREEHWCEHCRSES